MKNAARQVKTKRLALALSLVSCGAIAAGGLRAASDFPIRVNQVGYVPGAPKFCTMMNPPGATFVVQKSDTDVHWHTVCEGRWQDAPSGSALKVGDFSAITEPGDYRILTATNGLTKFRMPDWRADRQSYHFQVRDGVYDTLERTLFSYVRLQRCGDDLGWAGRCHQEPVPLLDAEGRTVRTIDARGGYHQSCDLRCWHDGISMSLYALLRYRELSKLAWDKGELLAEIRRGCDYFLKVIAPEGYVHDAQFAPIGWGPTHYYLAPATLGAQCNVLMLFARASKLFRADDRNYADRLLAAAKGIWTQVEGNPFFATFQPAPEKNLPPGAQPAEKCYRRQFRTSAAGLAERAAAALELSRVTGDAALGEKARRLAREHLVARDREGRETWSDWSYCFTISGRRLLVELVRTDGTDEWRRALSEEVDGIVRDLEAADMNPSRSNPARASSSRAAANAVKLSEAAALLDRPDLLAFAQRSLDWILGANPWNASYVEGIGQRQWQRPVFGQFFPSTPQIPGGVLHVPNGEYDMPPTMMTLWACARLRAAVKALSAAAAAGTGRRRANPRGRTS